MLQRSCTTILALIEPLVAEIWCTLENVVRSGDQDSRPGPQNRDFWQVVEIDPNWILACGFRHTDRCYLNIWLKQSAKSRTYGIDVCWGCQKWQLSVSIYSTLASRCLFLGGAAPAIAGAGWVHFYGKFNDWYFSETFFTEVDVILIGHIVSEGFHTKLSNFRFIQLCYERAKRES